LIRDEEVVDLFDIDRLKWLLGALSEQNAVGAAAASHDDDDDDDDDDCCWPVVDWRRWW
jgi:hypothetical protein